MLLEAKVALWFEGHLQNNNKQLIGAWFGPLLFVSKMPRFDIQREIDNMTRWHFIIKAFTGTFIHLGI